MQSPSLPDTTRHYIQVHELKKSRHRDIAQHNPGIYKFHFKYFPPVSRKGVRQRNELRYLLYRVSKRKNPMTMRGGIQGRKQRLIALLRFSILFNFRLGPCFPPNKHEPVWAPLVSPLPLSAVVFYCSNYHLISVYQINLIV